MTRDEILDALKSGHTPVQRRKPLSFKEANAALRKARAKANAQVAEVAAIQKARAEFARLVKDIRESDGDAQAQQAALALAISELAKAAPSIAGAIVPGVLEEQSIIAALNGREPFYQARHDARHPSTGRFITATEKPDEPETGTSLGLFSRHGGAALPALVRAT
jgi:hypothetical protein